MNPTTETICDKARRLAREEDEQYQRGVLKDKQAFLDQFGLTAHYDNEHRYDLCGCKWTCARRYIDQTYALFIEGTLYQGSVGDVLSLGRFLLQLDKQKAEAAARSIQAITNPKPRPSLWRRIRNWVEWP